MYAFQERKAALETAVALYVNSALQPTPAVVLACATDFLGWLNETPATTTGNPVDTQALTTINRKLDIIMTAQDDVNAAIAEDNTLLTDLGAQVTAVSAAQAAFAAEIATLEAAGVNTSGLVTANAALAAAQAPLDAAVAALTTASAPPAPVTPPAPAA